MTDPNQPGAAEHRAEPAPPPGDAPAGGSVSGPAIPAVPGAAADGPRRLPTRRRWVLPAVAGAVVVLLAAGGVTYFLTRSAEPGFGSPEAISELLADRGAPCKDFSEDGEGLADKRGTCYVGGEKIIIATFDSREEAEAHWERQLRVAADNETVGMVIGEKWTISGAARAYLRHAAEVLDAEYRSN